jgi:hypothetical protein
MLLLLQQQLQAQQQLPYHGLMLFLAVLLLNSI